MATAPDITTPDHIYSIPGDPRVENFRNDPPLVVMEWTDELRRPKSTRDDVDITGYTAEELRTHQEKYDAWMETLRGHLTAARYVVICGWNPNETITWDVRSISKFKGSMDQKVEYQGMFNVICDYYSFQAFFV
jgi:hypothetical protein